MGKKPKSIMADNANTKKKKKSKKKSKLGLNVVALKEKTQAANPFETIWSRRKFDILGKKRKGEERRVGLARSVAIEKRKKTLLKEYEQSEKSSVFLDKRIGEQIEGLGEFDKAIMRSQRERQVKLKSSKYNLSDGEEDELEIQGLASLPEWDDFEDEVLPDDDEVIEDEKRSAILKQLSALGTQNSLENGLIEGEEDRQKSRTERHKEIISKSKLFKELKAMNREENQQVIDQLDKDFKSLKQHEAFLSLTQPSKKNDLKALVDKSNTTDIAKEYGISAAQGQEFSRKEKPDLYDKLVNEMILDSRIRASDRKKTPEEIAQEEKEQLERLEEERRKRMLATDDSSDEDGNASKDDDPSTRKVRSISGDDLGDSFEDDQPRNKVVWIDDILRRENANDVESGDATSSEDSDSADDGDDEEGTDNDDDDAFEKTGSLKDWEQSDDDKIDTDLDEDEGAEGTGDKEDGNVAIDGMVELKGFKKESNSMNRHIESVDLKHIKAKFGPPSTQEEDLPYTIEAPKSLEEFSLLIENRSEDQVLEAIRRIRKFNSISIASENRKKMQVFYGVLLQYFAISANKKPLKFKLLNLLVKPLIEMSTEIPYFAAICARQRLLRTRTQFCEDIKNAGKSSWPSLKTLFLLRLWSLIFPSSDFRHVVMTPAILLMCEYLMRCPITCGRDVAIGSFLCSMVLSVTKQSKKFCPEAIMFLQTMLIAAFNKKPGSCHDYRIKAIQPLLCIQGCVNEIAPLDFLSIMCLPADSPFYGSDQFRASMLVAVVETLQGFVEICKGFPSFPEIFLPISKLLLELAEQEHIPNGLQEKVRDVSQVIEKRTNERLKLRRPLQMRKQKPVPIKLLNPKFEENFVKGRDYDPDRERAEQRKLKKLLKQEAKGAARELRKDNYFLFDVKQKDKAILEKEKAEKYGKAMAFLQEQEHAIKSGQLGRSRKRRR